MGCVHCFAWQRIGEQKVQTQIAKEQSRRLYLDATVRMDKYKKDLADMLDSKGCVKLDKRNQFKLISTELKAAEAACNDYFRDFEKLTVNEYILHRGIEITQSKNQRKQLNRAMKLIKDTTEGATDETAENADIKAEALDNIKLLNEDSDSSDVLPRNIYSIDETVLEEIRAFKFGEQSTEEEASETPKEVPLKEMPKVPSTVYVNRRLDEPSIVQST